MICADGDAGVVGMAIFSSDIHPSNCQMCYIKIFVCMFIPRFLVVIL